MSWKELGTLFQIERGTIFKDKVKMKCSILNTTEYQTSRIYSATKNTGIKKLFSLIQSKKSTLFFIYGLGLLYFTNPMVSHIPSRSYKQYWSLSLEVYL